MTALNTNRFPSQRHMRRAGISLLEILISIGIVGIGLIGVAALIPLAHHKANEGVNKDRMSAVARRAFRDFKVRGFDQVGSLHPLANDALWVPAPAVPGSNASPATIYYQAETFASLSDPRDVNRAGWQLRKQTYCFDPLGVADKNWVASAYRAANSNGLPKPNEFPSISPKLGTIANTISIPRVSIRAQRGVGGPMPFPQADRIFRVQDDLNFTISPEDKSFPRTQQYFQTDLNSDKLPDAARRMNSGDFSWMATLVPETRTVFDPMTGLPATFFPTDSDRYKLSIVVFNKRVLFSRLLTQNTNANLAANQFNQEIIGRVFAPDESNFTASSGGATKEVHIEPTFVYRPQEEWQIGDNIPAGITWSDVNVGNWVCLIQLPTGQPNNSYGNPYSNAILKWFQVIATDKPDGNSGQVILTLTGPDWTFYPADPNSRPSPPFPPAGDYHTYAVFVNNVATVFEKTVHLHTTSAFAQ